jgi:S-(hydroxymethyl)glutathione dehydrogenase/alcohol dehydrogenase
MRFGATHAVDPGQCEVVELVKSLTAGRGADHAFETAGNESALQTTLEVSRPGGTVVILGKMEPDKHVRLRYGSLMGDKNVRRSSLGGARAQQDIPAFAKAYLDGRLMLDELITERLPLTAINEGLRRVRERTTIRTVIDDFG